MWDRIDYTQPQNSFPYFGISWVQRGIPVYDIVLMILMLGFIQSDI